MQKIHLTEEKATLLITLYAKALDYGLKTSILNDEKASEIISAIDYDFEKLGGFGNSIMVVRARQMDEWLREFLGENANAVVLNLGCGLDTRIERINPAPAISWFDIDYPEVIALRQAFFMNRDGYQMLKSSVNLPGWLDNLPRDRPAIIIAEGILEYFTEDEVRTLFNRLTDHFSRGQLVFDVMNTFAVNSGKSKLKKLTGAEHKWAVDDVRRIDALDVKIKRINDIPVFDSVYMRQLPLKQRLFFGVACTFPKFRNMVSLLRYKF